MPSWTTFIINFDVNYQKRRIQFLIQELNTQYSQNSDHVKELDNCKMELYQILENIKESNILARITPDLIKQIQTLVSSLIKQPINDDLTCENNLALVDKFGPKIETILEKLSPVIGLDDIRDKTDNLIAVQLNNSWDDDFKQNLITNYLGFAFWDVITFSIMGSKAVGEFNEILVNRISPNDNLSLKTDPLEMPLKGTAMRSFGAFFSREDRENDYLWGRLNGAERLIDLLYKQATTEGVDHKIDLVAIKKSAFTGILDAEKAHLKTVPELFEKIKLRIDAL